MGVLADQFKARLTEMKARHAETDRQLEAARQEVYKSLDEMQRVANQMEEA